jgi:hypothetical protein
MDIRQLSVRYHTEQDRILVRIATATGEEVLMWLTRRMTLRFWPLINRVVIDHFALPPDAKTDGFVDLAAMGPRTREMLSDLRRQEAIQATDFATPYQTTPASQRPLGDAPLVVTEVNLTPKPDGQLQMNFREQLEDPVSNRGFQLDMPADLVFGVIQLLSQALEQSGWQVGAADPQPPTVVVVAADSEEIDFAPDAPRPTYLN